MRRRSLPLPLMLAELAFDSWQTIAHRMSMVAFGTCSPAEYQKMLNEKMLAAHQSLAAAVDPRPRANALIAPWHRAAAANAKKLGRRKRR
jgi:hypothetical protein